MTPKKDSTQEHLLDLVFKDDLTKLYNRRYYNRRYSELIKECKETDSYFSFLMIDVDHFKSINDTFGHHKGDEVLKLISEAMLEVVKKQGGILIRYAGDEFCILLPGIPKDKGREIGEELRIAVEKTKIPIKDSNESIEPTLSIGISNFPVDTENPGMLQNLADETAYISKKKGRNRVSTMQDKAPKTLDAKTLYRYFPCHKVTGRQKIMRKLTPLINPGKRKEGRPIIVLHGLPGVGKTRLLEETYAISDHQRCYALRAQSSPLTSNQPFVEILEPLSKILTDNPAVAAKSISNLKPEQIQALQKLLPVLSRYTVSLTENFSTDISNKKSILIKGLKEILITLATEKPVLIFLDEFHFSNVGTRMLLGDLKTDPRASQIAILTSVCDVETVKSNDINLLQFMSQYQAGGILEKIMIKPLGLEHTKEMISNLIVGLEEHKELIESIFQRTEGNPGKIENLLKKLIFKELISIVDGVLKVEEINDEDLLDLDWLKFSHSSLPVEEEIKELLARASVIGNNFTVDILSKIVNNNENIIYQLLEKAEKADLIQRTLEHGEEIFHFRNTEIKNDLYTINKENELKSIHKQVALAEKERVLGETQKIFSRLVYHLEKAGDHEKALSYMDQLVQEFSGLISPSNQNIEYAPPPPVTTVHWGEEKELKPDQELIAIRICKRLKIAIGNLEKFPEESEIVKSSIDSAYIELEKILTQIDILSFSEAEGSLLFNNKISKSNDKEGDKNKFSDLLVKLNLKGISFKEDLEREEFRKFLNLLTSVTKEQVKNEGGWPEILKNNQIENAQVSQRVFLTMTQKEMLKSSKIFSLGSVDKRGGAGIFPKNMPFRVSKDFKENLENLRDQYDGNESMEVFLKDVQHIATALSMKETEIAKMEDTIKELKRKITSGHKISLSKQKVHRKAVRKAIGAYPQKAEVKDINWDNDEFNQETEKKQTFAFKANSLPSGKNYNIAKTLSPSQEFLLNDKVKQDLDILIYELNYPDVEMAKMAGAAILSKGKSVIEPLFKYLINNENIIGRKTALEILKELEPNINKRLIEALMGNTNARQKAIILSILKDFPLIPISDISRILIRDPEHRIRRKFLSLLDNINLPDRLKIMLECLYDENEEVVIDVIFALGKLNEREAIPYLAKIVQKRWIFTNDERFKVQKAACKVLGQLGGEEALKALIEVLDTKAFLKWKKPDQVRAAAAYSLGYFPAKQAKPILDEVYSDPSPVVFSAVRAARFMLADKEEKEDEVEKTNVETSDY